MSRLPPETPAYVILAAALAVLAALVLQGCAGIDPRRDGSWTLTATAQTRDDSTSATLTRIGPAPWWVEPDASIEISLADRETTITASVRYGTDAAESASLFDRAIRFVGALFLGRASAGAIP